MGASLLAVDESIYYGCCKREFMWIGFAETVAFEFIQIVDCVNTVAKMHLGND